MITEIQFVGQATNNGGEEGISNCNNYYFYSINKKMKQKFKPSLVSYIVIAMIVCVIIGFVLLPKQDKTYLIYALIFSVVTIFFDGTILADWLEKRREKKATNPLLED